MLKIKVVKNMFKGFFQKSLYIFITIFLFLCITINLHAIQLREIIQTKTMRKDARDIKIEDPKNAPLIGETLIYKISWLGISVGRATAKIHEKQFLNGRAVYKITLSVKTIGFVNLVYKIDDRYTSFVDEETLGSLEHHVNRREGNYRKNSITIFDANKKIAYFENFLDKSKKEFSTPKLPLDGLSAAYYFRTLPLSKGKRITLDIINDEKNYHLEGHIDRIGYLSMGKLGIFPACRIKPLAKVRGKFIDKGHVELYFSTDAERIPLFIRVRGPLFTEVSAKLIEISG